MLEFELTRHHTGLILWGDYWSLERLHGLIHEIVAESPIIEDKEGLVLGLAYDVRKAFEGQRRQAKRKHHTDTCKTYGVEILWPVILVQVGLLRQAMAFVPTSRLDQAIMYELEHIVESATRAAMPVTADDVLERMRRLGSAPYAHLDSVLNTRCRYFIELPAGERLSVLPKLMDTFEPAYAFVASQGGPPRAGMIRPSAFAYTDDDWPDFEW